MLSWCYLIRSEFYIIGICPILDGILGILTGFIIWGCYKVRFPCHFQQEGVNKAVLNYENSLKNPVNFFVKMNSKVNNVTTRKRQHGSAFLRHFPGAAKTHPKGERAISLHLISWWPSSASCGGWRFMFPLARSTFLLPPLQKGGTLHCSVIFRGIAKIFFHHAETTTLKLQSSVSPSYPPWYGIVCKMCK